MRKPIRPEKTGNHKAQKSNAITRVKKPMAIKISLDADNTKIGSSGKMRLNV